MVKTVSDSNVKMKEHEKLKKYKGLKESPGHSGGSRVVASKLVEWLP